MKSKNDAIVIIIYDKDDSESAKRLFQGLKYTGINHWLGDNIKGSTMPMPTLLVIVDG